MSASRYVIGIDLGTSNSALAYVDLLEENPCSKILPIKQLETLERSVESQTMPSSYFIPPSGIEYSQTGYVGIYARAQNSFLPGRVIQSAKSWLAHDGVDRNARILPWHSEEIPLEQRLSPVEVSAAYLKQMMKAWDETIGCYHEDYRFSKQEITITVPASFDEVAQRLTLEAAKLAEYPTNVRLLEEPQAAFYFWLERFGTQERLRELFVTNDQREALVLVCDIGGGTTDFSLFAVVREVADGQISEIRRVAISEHLLLGGDNIDLALAFELERRFLEADKKLRPAQWNHLLYQSRALKEQILGSGDFEQDQEKEFQLSLPAEGSNLFSGSLSARISKGELVRLILEGFFPSCAAIDSPRLSEAGIKEWGLPYAVDTAVTRHLASFLGKNKIRAVLFTGGTLKPSSLQEHLMQLITNWQQDSLLLQLENPEMDLAVAYGAAYYGSLLKLARKRIRSNYARSVYLELSDRHGSEQSKLLCVLPQGFEAGQKLAIDKKFSLLVNRQVRFQLLTSIHREQDRPGDIVPLMVKDFHRLPHLVTVLSVPSGYPVNSKGEIDISLELYLNELGMLQLYCLHNAADGLAQRWQLDFNLRGQAVERDERSAQEINPILVSRASELIRIFYGKKQGIDKGLNLKQLPKELEKIFNQPRVSWPTELLRALWTPLSEGITRRGRSAQHESVWLSLAGYLLRPGYGVEGDSYRVNELWRCFSLGLSFPKESSSVVQWWIMWRRVSGGLSAEQQLTLFNKIIPLLRDKRGDLAELARLASSLERIEERRKAELAEILLERIVSRNATANEHLIWGLGRVGTRVPLYAGVESVVSPALVTKWFETVSELDWQKPEFSMLNQFAAQAFRMTKNRGLDVTAEIRQQVLTKMKKSLATPEQLKVVAEYVAIEREDRVQLFGEAFPLGLRLSE